MKQFSEMINRLRALHRAGRFQSAAPGAAPAPEPAEDRLVDLEAFGSNPGALRARFYVPEHLPPRAPLVVVLHGCTQTAAGYDLGAGWSRLADREGFVVLCPEQQRANNPNLCFNWFVPGDIRRGEGEALSIRQMIEALVTRFALDRGRIFVTGLSAGGAMAGVMLATYPDVFAGGAIIAGLPYDCAHSVPQALRQMKGQGTLGEHELQARLRAASTRDGRPYAGPWPRLSVWQGTADTVVAPANATEIIAQWRGVHGVDMLPTRLEQVAGFPHRVWCDATGREVMEEFSVIGMGHGTPLATRGANGLGQAGPFLLDVGISSTRHIAHFWGIVPAPRTDATAGAQPSAPSPSPNEPRAPALAGPEPERGEEARTQGAGAYGSGARGTTGGDSRPRGVREVIEDALRAAGLMK
ncbi:PHB depolymerase family esterase [Ancylobacter sp. A5.8]|uniref:extracellular catalytic domain type 1 short-chain-length polyhydroxyalkanoate depolymerase n=1 Tax=Ancylobacter gelatini TaxID=2919920 RepID=UPI001F4DFF9C|nr:PHB depolymerase family esterase [Ancylobacter gelatini]